ncbi:MAG: hypothetical protein ACM3JB_21745 [Acidobacteriaceae bacterium]
MSDLVSKTSRDWAFAEQLAEISSVPDLAAIARQKAESARAEYDLALHTLVEHQKQCSSFNAGTVNGASGVS